MSAGGAAARFDASATTRPVRALLTCYTIYAICTVVGFPFVWPVYYFKYHTLRYAFDDEGVSMSWGILFRREIYLTYRRIQDIHVTRNIIQRWFGLASVAVQTASGSAGAEMTIEGIEDAEGLRDYLYARMRGARGDADGGNGDASDGGHAGDGTAATSPALAEALALLESIRDEVRRLRMSAGQSAGQSDGESAGDRGDA